ncbi:hypothetical protein HBH56_230680 [Parastagonospora nodorum]|uniref:Uncharacterized protein n=1 Tax=Phaeosphaeria nodorum (strain SN15 / ATCC MYA-4574 / FGSC 10173) TaxID=321614 RepID=A0A7U2F641_PHANO|nr:hypothetical protein HBH56_230680 [Parastagonospora nodorum]QRC99430.1 hypothetical protein JI435_413450 [Parastagonospora nodorum SN15]KAH3924463.1 hypothetical protein HBH54_194490 [Parastagonospora nodorum]KAH3940153.1 hypothetical protein HBH53_222080 [Parastagonospora nodorum]KAH4043392.1 hypothetical protein HBH49_233450 [Parastagonospora nodorum]
MVSSCRCRRYLETANRTKHRHGDANLLKQSLPRIETSLWTPAFSFTAEHLIFLPVYVRSEIELWTFGRRSFRLADLSYLGTI